MYLYSYVKIVKRSVRYTKFLRLRFQPHGSTPKTLSRAERVRYDAQAT